MKYCQNDQHYPLFLSMMYKIGFDTNPTILQIYFVQLLLYKLDTVSKLHVVKVMKINHNLHQIFSNSGDKNKPNARYIFCARYGKRSYVNKYKLAYVPYDSGINF